jgi:hypothetical protein
MAQGFKAVQGYIKTMIKESPMLGLTVAFRRTRKMEEVTYIGDIPLIYLVKEYIEPRRLKAYTDREILDACKSIKEFRDLPLSDRKDILGYVGFKFGVKGTYFSGVLSPLQPSYRGERDNVALS